MSDEPKADAIVPEKKNGVVDVSISLTAVVSKKNNEAAEKKPQLKWSISDCGGFECFGFSPTMEVLNADNHCHDMFDDNDTTKYVRRCLCSKMNNKLSPAFNYRLHHKYAQWVLSKGQILCRSHLEQWHHLIHQ